jgi:hypothetical protein
MTRTDLVNDPISTYDDDGTGTRMTVDVTALLSENSCTDTVDILPCPLVVIKHKGWLRRAVQQSSMLVVVIEIHCLWVKMIFICLMTEVESGPF